MSGSAVLPHELLRPSRYHPCRFSRQTVLLTIEPMAQMSGSSPATSTEVDFAGAEFSDALFFVFAHVPLSEVFVSRGVCHEWRRSIDDCRSSSDFWRFLACTAASGQPPSDDATPLTAGVTWEALARSLACSPMPSFQRRLMQQNASAPPLFNMGEIRRMLEALVVLGELAVVDCPQTPLTTFITQELKSIASLTVYTACSQKPPYVDGASLASMLADASLAGRGLQRVVYGWWRKEAGALAARVRERISGAPAAAQALALQRFAGFVKFMVSVALPYIDRSYVRTFCSSHLRMLSVAEIGAHAVAAVAAAAAAAAAAADVAMDAGVPLLPLPPVPPLPPDDVTLGPDGEVDEEALLTLTTARMLNPLQLPAEVASIHAMAYHAINA